MDLEDWLPPAEWVNKMIMAAVAKDTVGVDSHDMHCSLEGRGGGPD